MMTFVQRRRSFEKHWNIKGYLIDRFFRRSPFYFANRKHGYAASSLFGHRDYYLKRDGLPLFLNHAVYITRRDVQECFPVPPLLP